MTNLPSRKELCLSQKKQTWEGWTWGYLGTWLCDLPTMHMGVEDLEILVLDGHDWWLEITQPNVWGGECSNKQKIVLEVNGFRCTGDFVVSSI